MMVNRFITGLSNRGDTMHKVSEPSEHSTAHARLFVPARIEILGKHTDYAGGRSIVCAIDRGIRGLARMQADPSVCVLDQSSGQRCRIPFGGGGEPHAGDWSNYVGTVVRRIEENFPGPLRGTEITLSSDLPAAAGLSSSSALMILIFLAIDSASDLRSRAPYAANIRTPEHLAEYLAAIESGADFGSLPGKQGVGTRGGSQDHTAILCSRAGVLGQFNFGPVRRERDLPLPADHVLAVAVSGVVAEKTGAARRRYNAAADSVARILKNWNDATRRADATLIDATRSAPDAPDRMRSLLSDSLLLDRLEQLIEESEHIIPAAGDALLAGDIIKFGSLVERSQRLAETKLRNQVPQTIDLARLARACGASAASAFGAGFGGSVWALIQREQASEFLENWRRAYLQAHPAMQPSCRFFTTVPSDGVAMRGAGDKSA